MLNTSDYTDKSGEQSIGCDLIEHLNVIEDDFRAHLEGDPRLASGVPSAQRADEFGFIQMSGLLPESQELVPHDESHPVDASHVAAFFEAGVADVDASAGPGALFSAVADAEDLAPTVMTPESAQGLRDLLAKLSDTAENPDYGEAADANPPRAVEDTLDFQALVDAGGQEVVRVEGRAPDANASTLFREIVDALARESTDPEPSVEDALWRSLAAAGTREPAEEDYPHDSDFTDYGTFAPTQTATDPTATDPVDGAATRKPRRLVRTLIRFIVGIIVLAALGAAVWAAYHLYQQRFQVVLEGLQQGP